MVQYQIPRNFQLQSKWLGFGCIRIVRLMFSAKKRMTVVHVLFIVHMLRRSWMKDRKTDSDFFL